MARTILAIAQEAAERDATAPRPAALYSSNDRIARILRTAAHDVLRDYLRQARWQGMSEFQSTWVWALQPGRYAYPMPPDFLRIVQRTEQRNGWPLGLVGPATPQAWARWVFGGSAVTASMGWRIRNDVIFIEPIPQAAELVAIEYISRYTVVSAIRAGDYDLSSNPLQTNAPIVARDGWLSAPDASLFQEGDDGDWDEPPGWDTATWGLDPHEVLRWINPTSAVDPLPKVRRPEFTADTDEPAFADDHLLSLGMTFHLQRALGKPYAERAAEYESEMEVRLAEDGGGARDFRVGSAGECWDVAPMGAGRWLVS